MSEHRALEITIIASQDLKLWQVRAGLAPAYRQKGNTDVIKPSTLLLAGGLLAGIAFFLPFFPASAAGGVFGPGESLEQGLQQGLGHVRITSLGDFVVFAMSVVFQLFTVATPVLLIAGGWLAPRIGRAALVWSLSDAVAALSYLLQYAIILSVLYQAFEGLSLGDSLQMLRVGFWLTALGCVLGVIGALVGWRELSRLAGAQSQGAPASGQGLRIRPEMLLVLCGGLAAACGFFIAPYLNTPSGGQTFAQGSLFDFIKLSYGYLWFVWPEVVMAVALLVCGLRALRGGQGAYMGSLSGALIGLPFLLGEDYLFSPVYIGTGHWLAVIGCVLGVIGALVGLRERQAAPVAVGAVEALAPP